ncbi:Prenylcysteine lyase-domain-containing protein, partial [Spinellus fusiger]
GGGAAGTSAAYWLSNAFDASDIDLSITLYESSDRLGGRVHAIPIKGDPQLGMIEMGASIFVNANHNLMNATKLFGLELSFMKDRPDRLGLWDGHKFLYEQTGVTLWDQLKLLWTYGASPVKVTNHLSDAMRQFEETFYQKNALPFYSLSDAFSHERMHSLLNTTAAAYFEALGSSVKFNQEIIQTATRANYGQDIDQLHAMGALVRREVSHDASSVRGGNHQLFQAFAQHSNATVRLNSKVIKVQEDPIPLLPFQENRRRYKVVTSETEERYDAVIMAAPISSDDSGIEWPFPAKEHARPYHTVHVTLIAGYPNPVYFGRTNPEITPNLIIATEELLPNTFMQGQKKSKRTNNIPFTSFAIHKTLKHGESIIKIFSSTALTEDLLDTLFINHTWTHRREWKAFPKLTPIIEDQWPSIVMEEKSDNLDHGVFYINAFENAISTMETQTVASKNVARIIHHQWCKYVFCRSFGDGWPSSHV